jgi:hypothetical protein
MVRTRKNSFEIDKRTCKGWGRTHNQKMADLKRRKSRRSSYKSLPDIVIEVSFLLLLGIGVNALFTFLKIFFN